MSQVEFFLGNQGGVNDRRFPSYNLHGLACRGPFPSIAFVKDAKEELSSEGEGKLTNVTQCKNSGRFKL